MIFLDNLRMQPYWYFFILLPYFIGAIPFSYLVTKFYSKKDIRKFGSKNAGSTNVTRVAGKTAGIFTFLLDFTKAICALLLLNIFIMHQTSLWLQIGLFLVLLGHTKSIFLNFTGGKGVACNFALWAYLSFPASLLMFFVWLLFYQWKKLVSLASIFGCLSLPLWVWYFSREYFLLAIFSSCYIIILHKSNIIRIIKRKENSFIKKTADK